MTRPTGFSKVKYQERILNELNNILRTQISDPRTKFVSLTHVELNKDNSVAKIYWNCFDFETKGDSQVAIEGMAGRLRSKLSQILKLRHTPELHFVYNSQDEDTQKIENLLKE
ncbi:MAG: 30S ribosome-binding factor RbfA [Halobacteriovoraceae bacterium]|nr:30S ribosome-binding factor RbfA [Halobacteriovoraceae bacterium]MCB9095707.1 30S ribosome-binding factor RbfA [Halobacteriovoraceae bacterium]